MKTFKEKKQIDCFDDFKKLFDVSNFRYGTLRFNVNQFRFQMTFTAVIIASSVLDYCATLYKKYGVHFYCRHSLCSDSDCFCDLVCYIER